MSRSTIETVLETVAKERIDTVSLFFTDILGRMKGFGIPAHELEKAMREGMGFDGSSIEGFVRIEESDLIALPDPSTFRILPWSINGQKAACLICDIKTPDGNDYEGDPRRVLKDVLKKVNGMGYTFYTGPELEYFYFKSPNDPAAIDREGYFDYNVHDVGTEMRKKTVEELEMMGIEVEYSHHEVAPSQHEIDLRYQEALKMADITMLYRFVVREVAKRNGYHASFMPKPIFGVNGSGMHVHQSLFKGKSNAFFKEGAPYHLSEMSGHYIAGLLKHVGEFAAITNQWVNSYKRVVPGYEAPVYISWGQRNRSALVRVPMYKPGKENATRIELRVPDPACNPYLAFAAMLAAGIDGVEKKLPLPAPIEEDIFEMSAKERARKGIKTIPGDLIEAAMRLEKSELMRKTLGEHIFHTFIENKKMEWDNYRTKVTDYEIENYLPVL